MHSHTCTKVTYNQVLLFAVHVNFANRSSSSGEIKLKSRFTGPESRSGTPTTGDFTLRRRSWGVPTMWRRLRPLSRGCPPPFASSFDYSLDYKPTFERELDALY